MTSPSWDPVAAQALARPDAVAVVGHGARTWAEWDRETARAAASLRSLGHGRLALRAQDRLTLATLALGAVRGGVTGVLIPVRWPAPLVSEALVSAGVAAAVSDLDIPSVETHGLGSDGVREPRTRSPLAVGGGLGEGPPVQGDVDTRRPGALAVFTSGSTGAPKAALLPWSALLASADGVISHLGVHEGDRWLLDLPVAHVGGLGVVLRCARAGAAMAVPEPGKPVHEAVETLRPTHASFVGTQLRRLLDSGADASSLRAILLGGSSIPVDLLDRAAEAGLPIAPSYGLTEMGSTVTATVPSRDLGTSGRLLPGREVSVREGEIHVRGATRFAGYLTPDGLTTPFDADGWFATGDLGRLDEEDRLVVEGRRGLMFVSGGENVQPEAIERALLGIEGVAEAAVVPRGDAEFGYRPVAFVRMESGEPDTRRLGAALRDTLPGFMVPVAFFAWEGANGMKPDRQALALRASS